MKKVCLFLIIFSLQGSTLFSCHETKTSEAVSHQVSEGNNLLPFVALMAKTAPLNPSSHEIYLQPLGILTRTLNGTHNVVHLKRTRAYSPSLFPETPSFHTTCIFVPSRHSSLDEIHTKKDAAIAQASDTLAVASFRATHLYHDDRLDRLRILHYESGKTSEATVSHINPKHQHPRVTMIVFPEKKSSFLYNVGDTVLTSILPPETPYPDHDILLASCAASDDKSEIVKLWALPSKS